MSGGNNQNTPGNGTWSFNFFGDGGPVLIVLLLLLIPGFVCNVWIGNSGLQDYTKVAYFGRKLFIMLGEILPATQKDGSIFRSTDLWAAIFSAVFAAFIPRNPKLVFTLIAFGICSFGYWNYASLTNAIGDQMGQAAKSIVSLLDTEFSDNISSNRKNEYLNLQYSSILRFFESFRILWITAGGAFAGLLFSHSVKGKI